MAGRLHLGAVAVALVALFASVASAADWRLGTQSRLVYATESITSEDVVINYRGGFDYTPSFQVVLDMTDEEVDAIDDGDAVDITITLVNAKLARSLPRGNFTDVSIGGNSGCSARMRDLDSEAGSASITLTVEADGDCGVGLPGQPTRLNVDFHLPPLTGLTNTKPVYARLTVDVPGGSGWASLSATANITTEAQPSIRYLQGLLFNRLAPSLLTRIDLAGGRTGFTSPGLATLSGVQVGRFGADACDLRVPPYSTFAPCVRQIDGSPFSIRKGGDGSGHLHVTVDGDFREDDVVFLDIDGNREPDSGEQLDLHEDGTMRRSFRLDSVAGNPDAAEGEAGELHRREGVVSVNLLYRPNGVDPLRPGDYRTHYSVTTSSPDVADKTTPSTTHPTNYTLVEDSGIAYAIPAPGTAESVRVRVKCEGATPCRLYLECDAPDGSSHFAQIAEPVPGRATLALSAEALSATLGLEEGDWEDGRMACYIHSTRDISVQQLTRSADVLANITYVDED